MFYITVKDRYMHKLGIISNDIPGAIHFKDDKQHEFLAEGAELFDLTIEKYANGILQENIGILSYGNILSFYDEYNVAHVYIIQHLIETRRTIKLQCSSLNLELIHEEVGKYSAPGKMSFFQYLNEMAILINSSMELNVNEVSDKLLTLTFDSQQTKLARLLSIVNSFDAECEMIPILTNQGLMDHIELNVYKANDGKTNSGVGRLRNDVLLTIGKDIQDITRDIDGTNLFNAVTVTGQNGETFTDINTSILNDNGVEEYYIRSGSSTAFAPISKMKYPATENEGNTDGWTRRDFQTQYTNQADLAAYAIRMLKSYAYPVITYNLSMTTGLNWDRYKLKVGDTIKISDMKFDDQGLVLSARVTEKVTSRANPNLNSVTLSNFVRRQVQTSNELQNLIKQEMPYNISILTDNGTVLKKAGDSTTLSVYMSKGQDIDTQIIPDKYIWSINGKNVPASGTLLVSYDTLKKDTNIITVQTIINDSVVAASQITISKIYDGVSPINLVIDSSNGYQFKNNIINTTFTAILYQNNTEIDRDGTEFAYIWTKTNADGTVDTAWNLAHQTSQKSITITNSDIWQRATFDCTAEPLN
ncbi:capsid and scaffold protein [Lactococcus phage CHPC971]|uniref:Capsid and scaffold protein n=1 Tax=Lactococcus phage CHPC971 TaxID=2575255 RepID=A0A4Y5MX94_9CAUD|nr:minor tail protein [Lactococcus phage CHPC971]QCW07622.1 capsid and scaffold protein [Lactococcus phage CHPC971]